jgi:hypothetical protein
MTTMTAKSGMLRDIPAEAIIPVDMALSYSNSFSIFSSS